MEALGIIASVVQIADVGLRLSIKLYTFGEIVASADRSVISISKDVSLTSGVLKELGQLLDKDKETGTFSETAVQTADGVVKECLEVFKEMDNIVVKRLPSLGAAGKGGGQGERAKRATVMLERLKWGYLQPKLELLRSNLDSLKSTLLLMLNVITYARQVAEKAELPSVIAEQKCLIEDLAQSNQEYILKFERLKLGIEEPAGGPVDDASRGGVVEMEPRKSMSGLTRKLKKMKLAIAGTSLQDKESTRGLGSEELNTTPWSSPNAQRSIKGSLATPPNADINNMFINTSVQGRITRPPVQERLVPTTKARVGFHQEALFKQLEHHSMLIKNLLKEVDEAQYKITFKSRLRMKGGIAGLHEEERRELEKMWGFTALRSAEQRLDSLMEGIGELPRVNTFAPSVTSTIESPYVGENFDTPRPLKEESVTDVVAHPTSIDPSSTYARGTTHRTDLLSDFPSDTTVHRDRLSSSARMTLPATVNETSSDTPIINRARTAETSGSQSMRRADVAKAKAEEQRKSSTMSMRKDNGDRIGGYTEPHLEEDDTGEGEVEVITSSIGEADALSVPPSAGEPEEATLISGPELAAPDPSAAMRDALNGRYAFDDVDEGDTEELVGKRVDGIGQIRRRQPGDVELCGHSSRLDSTVERARARQASLPEISLSAPQVPALPAPALPAPALPAPVPQAPAKFQPQIEQGDSPLANVDLVDRLISLWTTVKP